MLNITMEKDLSFFQDYKKCLSYLNSVDDDNFDYPSEPVNFHIYTEIKTDKELLCLESFLATQNLEKARLILWSDYDISNNRLLQPYKELIDLRVYNAEEEVKGTILEDCREWIEASDSKHYMKSGVLRFLVTHKYGGVWADMDMVFLRDFKPILDQEWAYMWGSELDFYNFGPCAAMMSLHKNSEHSDLCLEEILKTDVVLDSTVLDHILLAKVYTKRPFTVFPSTFFNTEWQMNTWYVDGVRHYDPNGLGTQTQDGWFNKTDFSNCLFDGAFAWHWHNSSNKDRIVRPESKFDILQRRTHSILSDKSII